MKKVKKAVKKVKKSKIVIDKFLVAVLCSGGHLETVIAFPTMEKAREAAEDLVKTTDFKAIVGEGYRK